MSNTLVSIIMPAYNTAPYIVEAIDSVKAQTYQNWELLITEDCSTDDTQAILRKVALTDDRIKVFYNKQNSGAATSRNHSLEKALGRYIAFLDADDLWLPGKLEQQLAFMQSNNIAMCYTSYETVEADGAYRNTVHVPSETDYTGFLKRPLTCSHTIMFDLKFVDKSLLVMPNIKRGQDGATWCQVLKSGISGYGLDCVLAKNRKHADSLSANKITAVKRAWYSLRKVEKLSLPKSAYYFVFYAFNAVKKRKRG
ncbi:MAG: glycosyltransferase family 2 protein [Oscillospiraceae bacterium]|nr:glycosyltransferase family 2 protein [Oscillospiraceae bacterium]